MRRKGEMGRWLTPKDRRTKEALEVAAAGELEAGDKFFGDGGTADEVATLENGDGEAGAGQIGSGGEAIVAAANHYNVQLLLLQRVRTGVAAAAQVPSPHLSLPPSLSLALSSACLSFLKNGPPISASIHVILVQIGPAPAWMIRTK